MYSDAAGTGRTSRTSRDWAGAAPRLTAPSQHARAGITAKGKHALFLVNTLVACTNGHAYCRDNGLTLHAYKQSAPCVPRMPSSAKVNSHDRKNASQLQLPIEPYASNNGAAWSLMHVAARAQSG